MVFRELLDGFVEKTRPEVEESSFCFVVDNLRLSLEKVPLVYPTTISSPTKFPQSSSFRQQSKVSPLKCYLFLFWLSLLMTSINTLTLHHSPSSSWLERVKEILEGPNGGRALLHQTVGEEGATALHLACLHAHLPIVEYLVGYVCE